MFFTLAFAQAAGGQAATPGILEFAFPFVAIIFVFYFLVSRPQQKRQKAHQDMLSQLKRGDSVITAGGIFGQVTGLNDKVVTLEVSDNVRIKVLRNQIITTAKEGAP